MIFFLFLLRKKCEASASTKLGSRSQGRRLRNNVTHVKSRWRKGDEKRNARNWPALQMDLGKRVTDFTLATSYIRLIGNNESPVYTGTQDLKPSCRRTNLLGMGPPWTRVRKMTISRLRIRRENMVTTGSTLAMETNTLPHTTLLAILRWKRIPYAAVWYTTAF